MQHLSPSVFVKLNSENLTEKVTKVKSLRNGLLVLFGILVFFVNSGIIIGNERDMLLKQMFISLFLPNFSLMAI